MFELRGIFSNKSYSPIFNTINECFVYYNKAGCHIICDSINKLAYEEGEYYIEKNNIKVAQYHHVELEIKKLFHKYGYIVYVYDVKKNKFIDGSYF